MAIHFSEKELSDRKLKVLQSMKEQKINALLIFKQEYGGVRLLSD